MKLGIIGFGKRLSGMVHAFKAANPEFEIAGIVDRDPEKATLRLSEEERRKVRFHSSLEALVRERNRTPWQSARVATAMRPSPSKPLDTPFPFFWKSQSRPACVRLWPWNERSNGPEPGCW
jgi:hypothetical protein